MKTLLRYWHTLRHLRPIQFYGRAWFLLYRPTPDLSPAPVPRTVPGRWYPPAKRLSSLVDANTFRLLGRQAALEDVGWNGLQCDKLWRYNQHYFDDLNAQGTEERTDWHCALLDDWVRNNPPGQGDGWEPYPLSLRIVNWIKWALCGNRMEQEWLDSLATQTRFLRKRLEYHLLGNHLFANAKALVFAGVFFEGAEADEWLDMGLHILAREVPEQILPDGGHFERSTMYHALALEDMLDLVNLFSWAENILEPEALAQIRTWRQRAAEMLEWLQVMKHPDGEIGFFNDAAFGVAPSCNELLAYAERLGIRAASRESGESRWLAKSGYARMATRDAVALLDLAPVGPDYLPGHAHADTLSFELSVFGQRLLVNSGTSCYGAGPERQRQRGTAAHNTVVVAGENSSEIWGGFRVARRARLRLVQVELSASPLVVEGAHDGYRRLPGKPIHHRRWEIDDSSLSIIDRVSVPGMPAQAYFHFHPEVEIEAGEGCRHGQAILPSGHRVEWRVRQGRAHMEPSTWHPRFGQSMDSRCLCVDLVKGKSCIELNWR